MHNNTLRCASRFGACLVAAAMLAAAPFTANAQAWPSRPIRWVAPFVAGGGFDLLTRAVAAQMSASLGQPIVVENRSGASGIVGTELVVRSAPDGYSLVAADNGTWVYNPLLYKKMPFDVEKDLVPVGLLGGAPLFLTVSEGLGVKTMKEFIELVKANPGKVSYGSSGTGSIQHMSVELLKKAGNLDIVHIPYKGAALGVLDLAAGRIGMMILVRSTAAPHVATGKLRILATTDGARSPMLPEVPTVSEAGLPGFEVPRWYGGVAAPGAVPRDILARLNQEVRRALTEPKVITRIQELGYVVAPAVDPREIEEMNRRERATWAPLVKSLNVSLD